MSPKLKRALLFTGLGVGGVVMFASAFVAFCALKGVPMHEVAVVGRFFPAPEGEALAEGEGAEHAATDAGAAQHGAAGEEHGARASEPAPQLAQHAAPESAHGAKPTPPLASERAGAARPSRAGLGVLSTFTLDAPFKPYEIEKLADELKAARARAEEEHTSLAAREHALDEREQSLVQREHQIELMKNELASLQQELSLRKAEVERDEQARAARAQGGSGAPAGASSDLAALFTSGKPDELAKRLVQFAPDEAGAILCALPDDRAAQLLNALPSEKWKDFASAYGKAKKTAAPAH